MNNGNLVLEVVFLLFIETGFTIGLSVVYSVLTTDCGQVLSRENIFRKSIPLQPYGLRIENKTSFLFDIKANTDVGIYATATPDSPSANNAYRFYIGGSANTKIELDEIRSGIWSPNQFLYGSFLSSADFKPFWFSWENGLILAGQGEIIGQNVLLAWMDTIPFTVRGIGIGTCWGDTGEWKIKTEVEENFVGHFSNCQRSNTRSELPVIANYICSELSCAAKCAIGDNFFGFNFRRTSNRCELLSHGGEPITGILRLEQEGWDFFAKCFDKETGCVGCFF